MFVSYAAFVLTLAGCTRGPGGVAEVPPQQVALQEVGELIRVSTRPSGRGPSQVSDLAPSKTLYPIGFEAVKSGAVVVLWQSRVRGEGEISTGGGEVVAYEKDTPTAGGYVVLTSGVIQKLTAAEFAAAPKAAKK